MEAAFAVSILIGTGIAMWVGIHYGYRWIDKQFELPPELDGTKPIVLPPPPIKECPHGVMGWQFCSDCNPY